MYANQQLLLAAVAAWLVYWFLSRKRIPRGATSPPGPKGLPLLGNSLDLPPYHIWFKFKEWADTYGPIYQLNLAGSNHVVVSTEKIADDLLTRRGNIYSSRGGLVALSEILLDGQGILDQPYNDRLRRWRKFFHEVGRKEALVGYQSLQWSESARVVSDLMKTPEDYETSLYRFTHALVFQLAFNKPVITGKERHVRDIQKTLRNIERIGKPGTYLVDLFPIMKYIPAFLAPWKQELLRLRDEMFGASDRNFYEAKAVYEKLGDNAPQCFATNLFRNEEKYNFSHEEARVVLDAIIGAGAGTTAAALMSFLLTMVLHPEWQKKAQKEIDELVENRMPKFDDLPQLPTVRAIVKETLRCRPVTAGGFPHMSTKDDVYEGMFIPAGTNVHPNIWAIHRNPEQYPNPEAFVPDRWLSPEYPTFQAPLTEYPNMHGYSAFGFGRRICPGLNFAEQSLYIATALILWACQINKKLDPVTGKEVHVPEYDFATEGFNTQPKPFTFAMKWRDAEKARLISEVVSVKKEDKAGAS